MIYPNIGVSMFMHMIVVAVGKINGKGKSAQKDYAIAKQNIFKRMLLALSIAIIIEFVLLFVVGSSLLAIYMGVTSKESNLNILENLYKYETKNLTNTCSANKTCYLPDALYLPV